MERISEESFDICATILKQRESSPYQDYFMNTKNLFSALTLLFVSAVSFGQITVQNTQTPNDLVQNVLLGFGVTASNITVNGSPVNANNLQGNITYFDDNGTTFPIPSGVLLTTGNGVGAIGPNTSGSFTNNTPATPIVSADPHLNAIASAAPTNGTVLEFDFVPSGDTISFNYLFGSDEYPEFSPSSFNDAFGFFLWGPGISGPYVLAGYPAGGMNLALIPGTSTPVTINNVGPSSNVAYYVNNLGGAAYGNAVQYDGSTTLLSANASIQCGQTYHIKLAICNVGDQAYDSGVFLQANSFASEAVQVAVATVSGDTSVYEGCSTADLMFIRPESQIGDTMIVTYDISGTATDGLDYLSLPNPITFLPGEDTVILTINPILDGIPDNNEYITITTMTITICGDTIISTGTLYILDELLIDIVETDPTVLCATDSVQVSVYVNDPNNFLFPPFTYAWTGGQTGQTAYYPTTAPPTGSVDYYVTITNSCGYTAVDTVTVTLNQTLAVDQLTANPTDDCGFMTGSVSGTATGVTGTPDYHWDNQANWQGGGSGGVFYDGATWNGLNAGWYYFTVTDDVCVAYDSIYLGVQNYSLVIDSMIPTITDGCGNANGAVAGYASGQALTLSPASYVWENQPGTASQNGQIWTNISPGWYILTVSVGQCETIDSVYVGMDNPPVAAFTASPTSGCNPITVNMINQSQNANTYYWDFGDGTSATVNNMDPQTIVYTQTATIQLIASQNQFCTDITDVLIIVENCGCTNPTATNYDPTATLDDGSCYFPIPTVNVPNVFTPNGDGDNDLFYLETSNAVQVNMIITNRWGNVMYDVTYDPNMYDDPLIPAGVGYGWDGTTALNIEAEDGTYFVKYTVTGVNGDTVEGHGFLQLVRN